MGMAGVATPWDYITAYMVAPRLCHPSMRAYSKQCSALFVAKHEGSAYCERKDFSARFARSK